ncbi:hypothetical protein ACH5RR_039950 [Cinchona calisaya]|uniref:F-box/LRR-repeat protein 15-like leucin rich repeat domain-containing protein n=1 Tax=Cinchona calisaya TaxID=153742 RepID=A0ABD2Y347_9GENT
MEPLKSGGKKRLGEDSDEEDRKGKKVKVFDSFDGNSGGFDGNIDGENEERIENETIYFEEKNQGMNLNGEKLSLPGPGGVVDSSADSEEVKGVLAYDVKGKGKMIEEENDDEIVKNLDFALDQRDGSFGGNGDVSDWTRYTGEFKEMDMLLVATVLPNSKLQPRSQDPNHPIRSEGQECARTEEHGDASSSSQHDALLGKYAGSFSTALKMVRDRSSGDPENLIGWKPLNVRHKAISPSLLDLCVRAIAGNDEGIVPLKNIPDSLRRSIANSICDLQKMDIHTLELFVEGSPTEICIKDCSWLTDFRFSNAFRNLDAKDLMVLKLERGKGILDFVMSKTLAKFPNSLPNLAVLSLKGACLLSDDGLKAFVTSAPRLKSINLSDCSFLTNVAINTLAEYLGSMLRELYIDNCNRIDAVLIVPELKKFAYLEVLSVADIKSVLNYFVDALVKTCGKNLKELNFTNCLALTDCSLRAIGHACPGLRSLNISNLDRLTDLALQFLADGCRQIQTLKLRGNKFSDEAIAAFLEASGESLKELSLNCVTSVGPCTAFSLAKCSRKLLRLDLSKCRKLTNEALGLIVDRCSSLKQVKIFGCTQITEIFLNGRSNTQVQILQLRTRPKLKNTTTTLVEPSELLLRYSPLEILSDEMPN